MSTQTTNKEVVLKEWDVQEFEMHERGSWWYFGATLVGGALVIGAVLTDNYLFALTILLIIVLTIFFERQGARIIRFCILESGVMLGERVVPYADVDHFYVVEKEGEGSTLYVAFRSIRRPRWNIRIEGQESDVVRKTLRRYVREEVEEAHEPFADIISRVFKL